MSKDGTDASDCYLVKSPPCQRCLDWGRTITYTENPAAVPCPDCGRLTWPNCGVNMPAGAAWAVSSVACAYWSYYEKEQA